MQRNKFLLTLIVCLLTFGAVSTLSASIGKADQAPDCLDRNGQPIAENDDQVVQWEHSTPNQFLARALVVGDVVQVYPDQNGHSHFAIQIGPTNDNLLEVIYNQDFGNVPAPTVGQHVEACGDYITSTAQAGPYPESPAGAIIHWVHYAPNPQRHPSGFLMIDGILYGQR
jgi:hypothetical protein